MLLGFGESVQPLRQRRFRLLGGQGVVDSAPGRRAEQVGEHRRHRDRMGAQRGHVDAGGRDRRFVDDQRAVEQFHRLVRGQRQDSVAAQPGQVGGIESAGHGAGLLPQPPSQRNRRQAMRAPVCGQRVEERVGGPVVGLARRPHQPGHRRKHHERSEIQFAGQLVQVPRRIDLGPQHRVDSLGGQRRRPSRRRARRPRESRRTAVAVRGISAITVASAARSAASHATTRASGPGRLELGDQFGRARRVRAAAAQQHQVLGRRGGPPGAGPAPNPPCRSRR